MDSSNETATTLSRSWILAALLLLSVPAGSHLVSTPRLAASGQCSAPGDSSFDAISGLSRQEIWAVGQCGGFPLIDSWGPAAPGESSPKLPGVLGLTSVAVVSTNDVWMIGSTSVGVGRDAINWDGRNWTTYPLPSSATELSATSDNNVWASTLHGLLLWNGYSWLVERLPGNPFRSVPIAAIYADAASGLWAVGGDIVADWDGSRWHMWKESGTVFNGVTARWVSGNVSCSQCPGKLKVSLFRIFGRRLVRTQVNHAIKGGLLGVYGPASTPWLLGSYLVQTKGGANFSQAARLMNGKWVSRIAGEGYSEENGEFDAEIPLALFDAAGTVFVAGEYVAQEFPDGAISTIAYTCQVTVRNTCTGGY